MTGPKVSQLSFDLFSPSLSLSLSPHPHTHTPKTCSPCNLVVFVVGPHVCPPPLFFFPPSSPLPLPPPPPPTKKKETENMLSVQPCGLCDKCIDKLWYPSTMLLMIHQWYSWPFVIFFLPPPYTWPFSEALCMCGLNVLRGEGRHCCSGWSSLASQAPVKEVVLHLPKGHLRRISYIIVHTAWTSSREAGESQGRGAFHPIRWGW